ncbi:MAG: selenide,water dikinase [Acidimicrobiales bacterium]|jgi:selenide,water dikinase
MTPNNDPRLLVDASTGDDAAVWKLDDDRALVFTADFITPLVDDARTWGRIAAANSVSDVYAMGGRPLLAINLVGWNTEELSNDLLGDVLEGASSIASDGGFVIAGGHTVDDPEPKFGLAVIGEVHPDKMLTNAGLRPEQTLILTKPLGIGVISTAVKRGEDAPIELAVAEMTRLNNDASRIAVGAGATGATDVTGFGLLGHLGRAALESNVDVTLQVADVLFIEGVRELAEAGFIPGGSVRNLDHARERLDQGEVDDLTAVLLADAQTSGGLVFGVDGHKVNEVMAKLASTGHTAAVIGSTSVGTGTTQLR